MRTAVHVDGTLNDARSEGRGWTLEIAPLWKALASWARRPVPPQEHDEWRVNFSGVQREREVVGGRYRKVRGKREDNWVWSPQGEINMHIPERWGYVRFAR